MFHICSSNFCFYLPVGLSCSLGHHTYFGQLLFSVHSFYCQFLWFACVSLQTSFLSVLSKKFSSSRQFKPQIFSLYLSVKIQNYSYYTISNLISSSFLLFWMISISFLLTVISSECFDVIVRFTAAHYRRPSQIAHNKLLNVFTCKKAYILCSLI
jgi:hypothetical protein